MNVEPTHQTPWDWRAAMQFISGGTGTGLLLFTAFASLNESAWLFRTGILALAFVGLGLFFVWLKLGRRLRPLYVFLNPRTSWMSREALFSIGVMVFGLAGILLSSIPLTLFAAVCALAYLYSQARILKEARGIPAWREPLIVPLVVLTGLIEGASLLLLIAAFFGGADIWLAATLLLLTGGRWYAWNMYHQNLAAPGAAPVGTVEALQETHRIVVPLGHIAPLVTLVVALLIPSTALIFGFIAGITALSGGWFLKFNLMTRAAYNQGFAITHTPARTPGYGGGGVKPGWTAPTTPNAYTKSEVPGELVHAFKSGELE